MVNKKEKCGDEYPDGVLKRLAGLSSHTIVHVLVISALFFFTRIIFLFTPAGRLGDADQAIMGMMAQQIASLSEFPLIYWENHYAGAPVAYIAAVIFHFFGSGFAQLRTAMLFIVLPGFFLFYLIYRRIFDSQRAFFGVLFLIFCPYLVLNYTTGAFGGYGESFLGSSLIILLSWKIQDKAATTSVGVSCFFLGLTCGFFIYIQFYAIPAVLAFAIPALWCLGENRIKSLLRFCVGGLVGLFPLIIYNFTTGGGTLTRAAAWILLIGRDDISKAPKEVARDIFLQKGAYLMDWFLNAPLMFGQYVIPAVLGHTLQIAAGLMLIVVLMVYAVSSLTKIGGKTSVDSHHRQFAFYLLVFILFQWVASLRSARHFMPLYFVIPIALFHLTEWHARFKKVSIVIILLLSSLQIIGWIQEFMAPRFDARPVVKIMESRGIREFYSSYWTGYPVMFLGSGKLIGSPMLLPYNEPFGDRRPQYTDQVRNSRNSAFVFGAGEEVLKNKFLSFNRNHDITYETREIDGTHIFYNLSKPVGVFFNKKNWDNYFFLK
jgi:hypothetical protein